jgi:hypothetical protein
VADLTTGKWISDDGAIRISPDGQPSVFDMIKVLGGQKNPKQAWLRLKESHPEVVQKCDYLKFPGPGQRETPVAKTKEDAYYILGLLPGAVGRKYREQAAKLFTRFLEDPAGLAESLVGRLTEDEAQRLEARLAGKRTRRTFTDELKEFGVEQHGYANCTNAVYVKILHASARMLKEQFSEQTGLPVKKINPRDHMSIQQLTDVETAERVAVGQLRRSTVAGNVGVERVVRKSAEFTRKLLDGEVDIPGLV